MATSCWNINVVFCVSLKKSDINAQIWFCVHYKALFLYNPFSETINPSMQTLQTWWLQQLWAQSLQGKQASFLYIQLSIDAFITLLIFHVWLLLLGAIPDLCCRCFLNEQQTISGSVSLFMITTCLMRWNATLKDHICHVASWKGFCGHLAVTSSPPLLQPVTAGNN